MELTLNATKFVASVLSLYQLLLALLLCLLLFSYCNYYSCSYGYYFIIITISVIIRGESVAEMVGPGGGGRGEEGAGLKLLRPLVLCIIILKT